MCLQKILKQNDDFNSFRKKLIKESKYFPEVTLMAQSDVCVSACTIVRKKQDEVWYRIPVISSYYTASPIVKQDWSFLIEKNIQEAYKAMILTVISNNIVDYKGTPIFIKDDCQLDEEQRLIKNDVLNHNF